MISLRIHSDVMCCKKGESRPMLLSFPGQSSMRRRYGGRNNVRRGCPSRGSKSTQAARG